MELEQDENKTNEKKNNKRGAKDIELEEDIGKESA